MHKPIVSNVRLATAERDVIGHGRCGTAEITLNALFKELGQAHYMGAPGDKVTCCWYLDTPRGPCAVRDYWWNRENEQSLNGGYRACLWAAAWLRDRLKIRAQARNYDDLRNAIHGRA